MNIAIPMTYTITLIPTEESDRLTERYAPDIRYEVKSEIYGCCIKLLCDDHALKDTWEDNFYSMSQNIRSHGRLYVVKDTTCRPDTVFFDPQVKTVFLVNMHYYGWIKSLALSLAGDILEDEHGIWSVHGACVDVGGNGICIVGASGSGKTTHTYGLLTSPGTRMIADDWFFSRIYGKDILAFGSEKNCYIQEELATLWKEFRDLVPDNRYDPEKRAIADVRWVIGKGRILPMTTLHTVIILKRDPADVETSCCLDPVTGLKLFVENNYFNPHLLVRNPRKTRMRTRFTADLLDRTKCYLINTKGSPEETQKLIRALALV